MANSFSITLTGDQEVPTNASTASGSGTVEWDSDAQAASYEITVHGLDFGPILGREADTASTDDDVTNMHVHNAARGVNGAVVFGQVMPAHDDDDLSIVQNDDGSWTVSGIWETTDPSAASIVTFAAALDAATDGTDVALYFNVHTSVFPGGEIRGQWVAAGDGENGEPDAIDWEALAARVLAFHAATGSWGLISEWLSDSPPDGGEAVGGAPNDVASNDVAANDHGDWHL